MPDCGPILQTVQKVSLFTALSLPSQEVSVPVCCLDNRIYDGQAGEVVEFAQSKAGDGNAVAMQK